MMQLSRYICLLVLAVVALHDSAVIAAEFDRRAESDEIIALMTQATREEATAIAQRIYHSGLADPKLAAVVDERLKRDFRTLSLDNRRGHVYLDDQYGRWMAMALGSFGIAEYRVTLEMVAKDPDEGGCPLRRVRSEAAQAARTIEWHAAKNAVMAQSTNHGPDDQEHISRLVNLLRDQDPTLQGFALARMRASRLDDPRLYRAIVEQLEKLAAGQLVVDNNTVDTSARMIKMLGATRDRGYLPLMDKIASAKTDLRLKRHAQGVIERFARAEAIEASEE